ncbi:Transmembrane protease serine 13 [Merluccius polli]|uniref:Transmembrane protease serine 13 n=1 Tax=Merluccius polli TaxID=89951 RepID=A0AA47NT18_MERPO|nr:Transmembrane protease serine 13 [Merluccius polli]
MLRRTTDRAEKLDSPAQIRASFLNPRPAPPVENHCYRMHCRKNKHLIMKAHYNDLPPPYYTVVVHTQPPLQPYEKVVHGGGLGASPPNQIHYIPQYPPPVVAPSVTHPGKYSLELKKTCCGSANKFLGGSGGTLLLLILLALAIWLGVKYGTRLAAAAVYNESEFGDDEKDQFSVLTHDTCPNFTVQCDAIKDCEFGSDETHCVRFGQGGSLQVRTSEDGRFLPVCHQGWNQNYADQTCAQLGFRNSQFTVVCWANLDWQIIFDYSGSSKCQDIEFSEHISSLLVECGQQKSTSRIIGGTAAKKGQNPWQVSLHFRGSHTCGGVLISRDFVVTAAHCFPGSQASSLVLNNWHVYAGVLSQDDLPPPYEVEKILLNENYNNKTNDQDIALLKLTAPVDFGGDSVAPACLPGFDQRFLHGTECWTSGFGTTEEGAADASRDLMEVSVDIIDRRVCNSSKVYSGRVSKNMICAGDLGGGRDSCQGDSGGPLVCQDKDDRWFLVGITSWGAGCGRSQQPGVYTKVTSMLPWIQSKMQSLSCGTTTTTTTTATTTATI